MPECDGCEANVPATTNVLDPYPQRVDVDYCPLCGHAITFSVSDS